MRAAVRAARQARWREAARGAAARLLALHTRRPALRRRVAAAAARLRAQEGTPVLLELPPLPPIDLVGLEEGNPVAAEARDAADYEAVCELAATWRTEQSEEAAAAAEEELAFAQACAWYVHVYAWHMHGICTVYARYMHGICTVYAWYMHGICMVYAWPLRRTVASGTPRSTRGCGRWRRGGSSSLH